MVLKSKVKKDEEVILRGTSISKGIAIGKPFTFSFVETTVPEYTLSEHEIESEIGRYNRALTCSREDLRQLQVRLEEERILDGVAILEAHQQMMCDPLLTTTIANEIWATRKNPEFIFNRIITEYQKKFNAMTDPFFRERSKDMQDIARRVMGYLRETVRISLADIPENTIVFARDLTPSVIAEADAQNVLAFVTEADGDTSHAAIVAKAKGIPYVTCIDLSTIQSYQAKEVIVDGRTGNVILNPHPTTLAKYEALKNQFLNRLTKFGNSGSLKSETYDGYHVNLSANIDMLNELNLIHQYGANGVGLFRSECVFLANETFPSEEEQFVVYRKIAEKMKDRSIVIRAFDIGGDKFLHSQEMPSEENPFLGCRAIRFLLRERDIFKAQLRAILRASAYGNVKVMFPMVSALSEVVEAKRLLSEARDELKGRGEKIARNIQIGCMIEVPSAAIVADLLAKECDFLSIGTNDLVQYSLAVDRGNQDVSNMYTPTDPSVLRLIKLIVSEANHEGIPVTVCGEIAADPRFTPLLLGLGVHELSVSTRYIPIIKHAIRTTSIVAASKLADQALSLTSAHEIQNLLTRTYEENVNEESLIYSDY